MTVRRSHDRRRRVLYSGGIEPVSHTAADRRRAAELRQARRPVAIYGQRVQRRLQARWYSIVPVRSRTYATTSLILLGIALLLIGLHAASVRMDLFRDNVLLSNPLRLDRTDSLGRFFQTTLFLYAGGMALLIYQLRRYRLDDYQGAYRLWRTVLAMMLVAAVNSACGLIDWSGAIVDAAVGQRLALSGADWVRMIVTMSLMILAVRVFVDVRRNRLACGTLVAAGLIVLIPESVRWNLTSIDDLTRWTIVTSAPLLATVFLVVGLGGYLRMIYCEVQEIEKGPSLGQRIRQIGLSVIPGRDAIESEESDDEYDSAGEAKPKNSDADQDDEDPDNRPRRRWFGLRKNAAKSKSVETTAADDEQTDADDADPSPKRAGLWSRLKRKKPPATDASGDEAETNQQVAADSSAPKDSSASEETDSDVDEAPTKRKGLGLGRFLKKRAVANAEISEEDFVADDAESEASPPENSSAANQAQSPTDDDEYVDPESIDWASLSKAERRRLKKVIKRQGRAA